MGSIDIQSTVMGFIPVQIDLPTNNTCRDVDRIALIEACWAITDWIYNDYDDTAVARHIVEVSVPRKTITNILSSSAEYQVTREKTVLDVMRTKRNVQQLPNDLHFEGATIYYNFKTNRGPTLLFTNQEKVQAMLQHILTNNDQVSTP